jgi:hypothetical protein
VLLGLLSAFTPTAGAVSPSAESIYVDIVPQNPSPGENTNISLSSYSAKLDSVLISWSINGKTVQSGIGKKSLSLSAPASGKENQIIATIALPNNTIKKEISLKPSVATLLWQASASYVPPFYKGKALPGPGTTIKVVFLPEIYSGTQLLSPRTMTYSWKKDYTNNPDGSGYGKNSFIYTSDYLDASNNISVSASTVDQKYKTTAAIDINTFNPKLLFYKNDLTMGTLWEQSTKDGAMIIGDEIIEATPYFISSKNIGDPFLVWSWFINDLPVSENFNFKRNLLPIKTQIGISGSSIIRLEVDNLYKLYSTVSNEIKVKF